MFCSAGKVPFLLPKTPNNKDSNLEQPQIVDEASHLFPYRRGGAYETLADNNALVLADVPTGTRTPKNLMALLRPEH